MSLPPSRITINDTFGAGYIGSIVTATLYGITTLQTYFYFVRYPKDRIANKILVLFIWILDTLQTIFVNRCMYYYLVSNYANPSALASGHWSLFVSVAVNVAIAFSVQCYFTSRIFRLSNPKVKWWLTSAISLIVLAHFCFGMETIVYMFIKKDFSRLPEITLYAALPFAIFAVLSDVCIAAALCVLLHGSRTGFRKTDTLLSTLIIYAINRCLLTSVVAVVEVIVFVIFPNSLWFLAIDFVIGKLYANSLLATLNTRRALRCDRSSTMNSVPLSNLCFDDEVHATQPDATHSGHLIAFYPGSAGDTTSSDPLQTSGIMDHGKINLKT